MKYFSNKAQNLMEYTIILGVIVLIFLAVNPIIKRNVQGMIKTAADQIGTQQDAEQDFNVERGYVIDSYVATDSLVDKIRKEGRQPGVTDINYGDRATVYSHTQSILGFSKNQN